MTDTDPTEIERLMSIDPWKLTKTDLQEIVRINRERRSAFLVEDAKPKGRGKLNAPEKLSLSSLLGG